MQLPIISTKAAFAQFSETLQARGMREALAYLLSLTDYRFIGLFRFDHGLNHATAHYDRQNPDALDADGTPDADSYGEYVRDCKRRFVTADAMGDERLRNHPARQSVLAYCGVPVADADGVVLGCLCHYDVVPRDPGQIDMALMEDVAGVLAREENLRGRGPGAAAARTPLRQGSGAR
jgi:GAF domain-containing protein